MNWTTKPVYLTGKDIAKAQAEDDFEHPLATRIRAIGPDLVWDSISDGSKPIKPSLTINEDGPLLAGEYTIEPWPITPIDADKFNQHGNTILGWDLGNGADKTVVVSGKVIDGKIHVQEFYEGNEAEKLLKEYNNKVPTHDPYTNPNAHIYYSCDCGNILDPGTKRFAELNNAAMDNGWKVRWGHEYYEPFCPNCVKLKGIE